VKDYYTILGVNPHAAAADIKRAYRKLAVRYHPDKNPDPRAHALFQEINEAYDVLGDPDKRKIYDIRLGNPLAEIQLEEEPRPQHRDPAYRRNRPHPRPQHRAPTPRELMAQYLPYFRWLTVLGMALALLLALDLALPHQTYYEKVSDMHEVRGRKGAYRHDVLTTNTGRRFVMYNREANYFYDGAAVNITVTPLFSTEMRIINDEGYAVELGYIYGGALKFFPVFLFAVSLLGLVLREHTEFAFNASIVCGALIVILLYLVYSL
jgi:curved DNA-binding protein CbpA